MIALTRSGKTSEQIPHPDIGDVQRLVTVLDGYFSNSSVSLIDKLLTDSLSIGNTPQ